MNPYNLMLELRNNKLLFHYLELASVILSQDKGWIISGQSKEGSCEIFTTKSNCLCIILPIPIPSFINLHVIQKLHPSIQESINGIVSINMDDNSLDYFLHIPFINNELDSQSLTNALEEFYVEKQEINQGFINFSREVSKMSQALSRTDSSSNSTNSLWEELDNIDKSNSEDNSEEDNDNLDN